MGNEQNQHIASSACWQRGSFFSFFFFMPSRILPRRGIRLTSLNPLITQPPERFHNDISTSLQTTAIHVGTVLGFTAGQTTPTHGQSRHSSASNHSRSIQ